MKFSEIKDVERLDYHCQKFAAGHSGKPLDRIYRNCQHAVSRVEGMIATRQETLRLMNNTESREAKRVKNEIQRCEERICWLRDKMQRAQKAIAGK